jgi:hypothetical protein
LYANISWTLRAADQKYLESVEMWCWRRMEKISWTDHVRNEIEARRRGISCVQKKDGRLSGLVTTAVGIAF